MPKKTTTKPKLSITLDENVVKAIDSIASESGISRSQLINQICLSDKRIMGKIKHKKSYSVDQVAKICYSACKSLQQELEDTNYNPVTWDESPAQLKKNCITGVQYVINNIDKPELDRLLHENWLEIKQSQGVKYGKKYDYEKKTHPLMLEYNKLPESQRLEYRMFVNIVKSVVLD